MNEWNAVTTVLLVRGIERLLIQVGALGCVVCGVMLYRWGVLTKTSVEGEVKGFKFAMKNAAPGAVLALFGTVVMGLGLSQEATVNERITKLEKLVVGPDGKPRGKEAQEKVDREIQYSGGSATLIENLKALSIDALTDPVGTAINFQCEARAVDRKGADKKEAALVKAIATAKFVDATQATQKLHAWQDAVRE